MSNDPLNFFILEAGDCLERLDSILANAGPTGPDAMEFVRQARTLRGAAVVHRLGEFGDVAAGVERVGRALRDGAVAWTPALAAALVAAVDDLKILLHNLRIWGPNEQARAARRAADLERFAGHGGEHSGPTHDEGVPDSGSLFLAQEAIETADALEPVARGGATGIASALEASLAHIRTLRGVAAVHDMPPLSETLDAVERLARSLGLARAVPNPSQCALIGAAAALLRRAAGDLRATGRIESGTAEEARFAAARDALTETNAEADRILPIADLFYSDGRDGIVSRAPSPPTSSAERFRLEVVSLAEHLQALVRGAQSAGPGPVPDGTAIELRSALHAVQRAAESFGERDVAYLLATFTEGHPVFDFLTLHALDELATSLAEQPAQGADLTRRVAELVQGRALDVGIALGLGAPTEALTRRDKPARAPEPKPRDRHRTPTGTDLQAFLADGIAGIAGLGELPLIDDLIEVEPPVPSTHRPERQAVPSSAAVVPIESLLYRGESALSRARSIRDALREDPAPSPDALAELYDLLDLATPA